MADKSPSSDDLIAEARAEIASRRGSQSAAMAKAARDRTIAAAASRQGPADAAQVRSGSSRVTSDATPMTDRSDVSGSGAAVTARTTTTQRPSPPASARKARPRRADRQPATRPEAAPTTAPSRPSRPRRVWTLLVLGFIAFSILRGNLGGIPDAIDELFGDDSAVPASEAPITNLAGYQPTASSEEADGTPPSQAVDVDTETWWSSGSPAPQWITVEFAGPATIHRISLLTRQSSAGDTVHQVYGWGPEVEERMLWEFSGRTDDREVLLAEFAEPVVGIQAIAILTTRGTDPVAWREIQVFGTIEPSGDSALGTSGPSP